MSYDGNEVNMWLSPSITTPINLDYDGSDDWIYKLPPRNYYYFSMILGPNKTHPVPLQPYSNYSFITDHSRIEQAIGRSHRTKPQSSSRVLPFDDTKENVSNNTFIPKIIYTNQHKIHNKFLLITNEILKEIFGELLNIKKQKGPQLIGNIECHQSDMILNIVVVGTHYISGVKMYGYVIDNQLYIQEFVSDSDLCIIRSTSLLEKVCNTQNIKKIMFEKYKIYGTALSFNDGECVVCEKDGNIIFVPLNTYQNFCL